MAVYYCSQNLENATWVCFVNQDYHFSGRRDVIEIVSHEEQNIQEAHSPALIESCTFSSDSEQEKALSTYSR